MGYPRKSQTVTAAPAEPGELLRLFSGLESFVHVDVGFGVWVALSAGVHDWPPGTEVDVRVDPDLAFIFDAAGKISAPPALAKTG